MEQWKYFKHIEVELMWSYMCGVLDTMIICIVLKEKWSVDNHQKVVIDQLFCFHV